ncbi:hypothetical protein BB561_003890 [Smittium simulii]|uniref:Uncharacterized protein n=1 Tax=Smittium simulii TaxID=133385 RepID=A0A2T9YJ20_9FUNG|nr:hypothetical protein BB561_003890 [Smittium simulii]
MSIILKIKSKFSSIFSTRKKETEPTKTCSPNKASTLPFDFKSADEFKNKVKFDFGTKFFKKSTAQNLNIDNNQVASHNSTFYKDNLGFSDSELNTDFKLSLENISRTINNRDVVTHPTSDISQPAEYYQPTDKQIYRESKRNYEDYLKKNKPTKTPEFKLEDHVVLSNPLSFKEDTEKIFKIYENKYFTFDKIKSSLDQPTIPKISDHRRSSQLMSNHNSSLPNSNRNHDSAITLDLKESINEPFFNQNKTSDITVSDSKNSIEPQYNFQNLDWAHVVDDFVAVDGELKSAIKIDEPSKKKSLKNVLKKYKSIQDLHFSKKSKSLTASKSFVNLSQQNSDSNNQYNMYFSTAKLKPARSFSTLSHSKQFDTTRNFNDAKNNTGYIESFDFDSEEPFPQELEKRYKEYSVINNKNSDGLLLDMKSKNSNSKLLEIKSKTYKKHDSLLFESEIIDNNISASLDIASKPKNIHEEIQENKSLHDSNIAQANTLVPNNTNIDSHDLFKNNSQTTSDFNSNSEINTLTIIDNEPININDSVNSLIESKVLKNSLFHKNIKSNKVSTLELKKYEYKPYSPNEGILADSEANLVPLLYSDSCLAFSNDAQNNYNTVDTSPYVSIKSAGNYSFTSVDSSCYTNDKHFYRDLIESPQFDTPPTLNLSNSKLNDNNIDCQNSSFKDDVNQHNNDTALNNVDDNKITEINQEKFEKIYENQVDEELNELYINTMISDMNSDNSKDSVKNIDEMNDNTEIKSDSNVIKQQTSTDEDHNISDSEKNKQKLVVEIYGSTVSGNKEYKKQIKHIYKVLAQNNIQYNFHCIAANPQVKSFVKRKALGSVKVPQFYFNGELIGFYDDFVLANNKKALDEFFFS